MKKFHCYKLTDVVLSVVMAFVAAYAIISGIRFGIITDGRPGTGFQPVFAGLILLVSSLCLLVRTIKDGNARYRELLEDAEKFTAEEESRAQQEKEEAEDRRDTETWLGRALAKAIPNAKLRWALLYLIGIWATIFIIDKLGMYFGLWLFTFLYLKFISKFSWVKSLLISAAIAASLYVVFTLMLKINVPKFLNGVR